MYYTLFKYLLVLPISRFCFRPWIEGEQNIPACSARWASCCH